MFATSPSNEVSDDQVIKSTSSSSIQENVVVCPRQNYGQYFNNQCFNDLKIVVGCKIVHVSKILLAQQSKVFHIMFQKELIEENTIRIDDVNDDIFVAVLQFLYTGVVPSDLNQTLIKDWLVVLDKYEFFELKKELEFGLATQLNLENAIGFLIFASDIGLSRLRAEAIDFIQTRWPESVKVHKNFPRFTLPENLYHEVTVGLLPSPPVRRFWQ